MRATDRQDRVWYTRRLGTPGEAFRGSAACQPIRFYAMNDGGLRGRRDRKRLGTCETGHEPILDPALFAAAQAKLSPQAVELLLSGKAIAH
jgi:hypothetical protein